MSWDHLPCINSYTITYYQLGNWSKKIYQVEMFLNSSDNTQVFHNLHYFKPCSDYAVDIRPETSQGDISLEMITFRTKNPAPRPPEKFSVEINSLTRAIDVTWSQEDCVTGYRVRQKINNLDSVTNWTHDNQENYFRLEDPMPCLTYWWVTRNDN